MQEHRQQAQVEDSWIYTSVHFEDILNFKGWHINVIVGRMYFLLMSWDCNTDLERLLSSVGCGIYCNKCKVVVVFNSIR
jgi:hypothetical protein